MAHIGQEARLLLVGGFQLGGALPHPLLQRGQHLLRPFAARPQGAGEQSDLVVASLDVGQGRGAVMGGGVGRQPPQRICQGPASQEDHQERLRQGGHQSQRQDPDGRTGGRPRERGPGIGDQQVPVRTGQPVVGDQMGAIVVLDHAEGPSVTADAGDQLLQAEAALVGGDRGFGRLGRRGEARPRDQVPLAADHQIGAPGDGVVDRFLEIGGEVDGRAEGADEAAVDIGGGGAGGGEALAFLVLNQPLQAGAAGHPRRIVGRLHHPDHLLVADVQAGGRIVAVEHQPVRPVGAEQHQSGAGRVEIEVVVFRVDGLADMADQVLGGDPHGLVLGADLPAVGDEGADAVEVIPIRLVNAIERLWTAAARAVRLEGILRVEEGGGLGGRHAVHAPGERRGGGVLHIGQGDEAARLVGAALGDVVGETLDLHPLQGALEHHERGAGRERGHRHGGGCNPDQESAGEGDHIASGSPSAADMPDRG